MSQRDRDEDEPRRKNSEVGKFVLGGVLVFLCLIVAMSVFGGGKRNPGDSKDDPKSNPVAPIAKRDRTKPITVDFKSFATFPEESIGKVARLDGVWLHGDMERVDGSKDLSPTIQSQDGKYVFGKPNLDIASGAVFVAPEKIGRALMKIIADNKKNLVNIFCEVSRRDKAVVAVIYRVEFVDTTGKVFETIGE